MSSTVLSPAPPGGLSSRRKSLVLAICCISMLIVIMDMSVVNVALPGIGRDLHASESGLQWTVDAYSLVLAAFLVMSGSLSDRVGRRRVFLTGLVIFGLGSLLCGLAPGTGWLIGARALQAIGGTMLNPASLAIIANTFTGPSERARAIGAFGSVSGLALALGPILGGGLVGAFGWRSVFWINVPVAAVAIVCTARFVPESRAGRARRFDPVGQALMILILGSVVYAIIESSSLGWTSPLVLGLLAAAAVSVAGIIAYEPRRVDPLLELRLFRSLPFTAAIVMALLALCGFGAFLFITTQYLQDIRGLSPVTAGLCLIPVGLPVLVLSPVAGRVTGNRGPLLPLLVAGTALALGGLASLWIGPTTPLTAVLAVYLLFGVFLGTVNPPITNSAVSGMPRSMAGLAGSLASTGRQAGTTLGVAISGTLVAPALARLARGGTAFTNAAHGVWYMVLILGAGIVALGLASTKRRTARATDWKSRPSPLPNRRGSRPWLRHQVKTPGRAGSAAQQSPHCQPASPGRPVPVQCLGRVLRAAWRVRATRRQGAQLRLVEAHAAIQQPGHRTIRHRARTLRHRPDPSPYRGTRRPHRKGHVQLRAGDPEQTARNNAALPATRKRNEHRLPAGSRPMRESETPSAPRAKPQCSTRPQLLRSHVFPPQLPVSVALLSLPGIPRPCGSWARIIR